jgi:hypothetical protein
MLNSEKLLEGYLNDFPPGHPERTEVEEELRRLREKNAFLQLDELKEAKPPDRVLEVLETARKRYGDMYEPIAVPTLTLRETTGYPQGWIAVDKWFLEMLQKGKILPENAATISQAWLLWDKTARPNYDEGQQLYGIYGNSNDPLSHELTKLRKQGAIEIPSHTRYIPKRSRFGISADELDRVILPLHAKNLGLRSDLSEQVIVPPYGLFNFIGNTRHPELGRVNTWEWMDETFEDRVRLVGGRSDCGGLARVNYLASDDRYGSLGFRPLVVFPPKAR